MTAVSETADASTLPALASVDHERCDLCGNRAYVITAHPVAGAKPLPMSWCGHHFAVRDAALRASGASVAIDLRHLLLAEEKGAHA